jgi:integrase
MALKGQRTKSSYLDWDTMKRVTLQLERDGDYKFSRLVAVGCYLGLRISDTLNLKWQDLLDKDHYIIIEKKTKKERRLTINMELKTLLNRHRMIHQPELDQYLFVNRYGLKPISIQYVNEKLKEIFKNYKIQGQYSSHFMRKTLGRRVWSMNNYSEKSLILLSQLFNHGSVSTTKIYLGIEEEIIADLYMSL